MADGRLRRRMRRTGEAAQDASWWQPLSVRAGGPSCGDAGGFKIHFILLSSGKSAHNGPRHYAQARGAAVNSTARLRAARVVARVCCCYGARSRASSEYKCPAAEQVQRADTLTQSTAARGLEPPQPRRARPPGGPERWSRFTGV